MNRGNNRGQTLVFIALAIFVILGFAALGIDVGYMYSVRHELQRCADAGALAGATPFTTQDWNDQSARAAADDLARQYASKDPVVLTPLNRDTEVAVTFPAGRYGHIAVDTSRNVNLFFARIFGMPSRTITAHAMARVSNTDENACIKPWAVPLPWVDNNTKNGLFDPAESESVKRLCESDSDTDCVPKGTQMTLKIGSPSADNTSPSGQQTSGQFFIIQGNSTDPFQGAATYKDYIAGDGCLQVNLNEPVDLMPGNKMGPTVQPVRELVQSGDDWDGTGDFPVDRGNRLVYIVVYDPRVPISGGGNTGSSGTQAAIPGNTSPENPTLWFAGFYLDDISGNGNDGWITGKYTGVMLSGTGSNPTGPTGSIAKHVELVE